MLDFLKVKQQCFNHTIVELNNDNTNKARK